MSWRITATSTAWAEGGDAVYTINVSGTTYRVHEFRSTREATLSVMKSGSFQYLLVGGGGAGAGNNANAGGGGGAGGLLTGTISLSTQAYPITVGSGGLPVIGNMGQNGSNTTAFGLIALGGGAGVPSAGAASTVNNGGSGGGAGQDANLTLNKGGQGTQGQGNNGGNSSGTGSGGGGGGGGGAGGVGQDGTSSKGGDGGPGIPLSLTGSVIFYAGGGGATQAAPGPNPGLGGTGGGGNAATSGAAQNGTDGLGGGGGACRSNGVPGRGGSGIVIVRYAIA